MTAAEVGEPNTPLTRFVKDQFKNSWEPQDETVVHHVSLIDHPTRAQRESVCQAARKDSKESWQSCISNRKSPDLDEDHYVHSCEQTRRSLTAKELKEKEDKAVMYFHKVKDINEMCEIVSRKSSKESIAVARAASKERAGSKDRTSFVMDPIAPVPSKPQNGYSTQSKTEVTHEAQVQPEATPAAEAPKKAGSLLAQFAKENRKSSLLTTAANAIMTAGQDGKRSSTNRGSIGGEVVTRRNTLLERLKEKGLTSE